MLSIVIILSLSAIADCVKLGKADNYIMIGNINRTLVNVTIDQCKCEMLQLNGPICALNYFLTNQSCQVLCSYTNAIQVQYQSYSTLLFFNRSLISVTANQVNGKRMYQ